MAVCPNCGQRSIDIDRVPRNQGDQLLVHKHAYLFHSPRRWEVVVFRNPYEPRQAYVKRIVGLPRERIQLIDGDLFVNGKRQRKNLTYQRAMRILVDDHDYQPSDDPTWRSRWKPDPAQICWQDVGDGFDFDGISTGTPRPAETEVAWVRYRHWIRSRNGREPPQLAPIADTYGYNLPGEAAANHTIADLMLAVELTILRGRGQFMLQMSDAAHQCNFVIDTEHHEWSLAVDGKATVVRAAHFEAAMTQKPMLIEMSLFDRQLLVAVNGRTIFEPWIVPDDRQTAESPASTAGFAARRLEVRVRSLKLYRDVYYTRGWGRNGVDSPYTLGDDEYFVLGDNSPVSLDSRSWADGAVSGRLLIGKPFLVHLPSRPGKIRFGSRYAHFRIPDFSRIRYIH